MSRNVKHSPEEINDLVYDRVDCEQVDRSPCINSNRLTN